MAVLSQVVVRFAADIANFTSDMNRAGKLSEKNAKKMSAAFKRSSLVIGAALTASVVKAVEFEKAMAEVSTLLGDTSGMDATTQSVKDLSIEFGQAPVEQAKALYQIISAGAGTAAEQTTLLTAANKLAVGGITSVSQAADGLTGILNAYGLGAHEAGRISDIMFATMKAGKTTIGEISTSIADATPIAATMGVTFEEVGAALATVTAITGNTSTATTQLRQAIASIGAPAEKSKKLFAELGIEFGKTAITEGGGLLPFFRDVIEKTGGSTIKLKKLLGSIEAVNGVLALSTDDFSAFSDALDSTTDSAGMTQEAFDKMSKTADFQLNQLKSTITVLSIEIGEALLPKVNELTQAFTEVLLAGKRYEGALSGLISSAGTLNRLKLGDGIDKFREALAAAVTAIDKSDTRLQLLNDELDRTRKDSPGLLGQIRKLEEQIKTLTTAQTHLENAVVRGNQALDDEAVLTEIVVTAKRMNRRATDEAADAAEDWAKELDALRRATFGGETALADFTITTENLTRDFEAGEIAADDYRSMMLYVAEQARETAHATQEFGEDVKVVGDDMVTMSTIIEDAWKRLGDTLNTFWRDMLDGGGNALESLKNLVKDTFAQILAWASQKIVLQIGASMGLPATALGGDGSGAGSFASLFAPGMGGAVGGALLGAAAGYAGGRLIGSAFGNDTSEKFGGIGGALGGGAMAAILGQAGGWAGIVGGLGSIAAWAGVGAVVLAIIGKILHRDPRLSLSGGEIFGKNGGTTTQTAFGNLVSSNGAGGVGDVLDDIINGITEWDATLASFMSADQIGRVSAALKGWDITLRDSAVTMENILGSRMAAVLNVFGDGARAYVMSFDGIEAQTEALAKYLKALDTVTQVLAEFIGSTPGRALESALDTGTSTEKLRAQAAGLSEAFASFDGTPEMMVDIAQRMAQRYASEIEFLGAIDALVRNIAASIADQQARISAVAGLGGGFETDTAGAFASAQSLFADLSSASAPEEIVRIVADIQRLVDSFFGGLNEGDQALMGQMLVDFLGQVNTAAAAQADMLAQSAIDEGILLREQAQEFADTQGIQLDAIAVSTDNVSDRVDHQTDVIRDGNNERSDDLAAQTDTLNQILFEQRRQNDLLDIRR